MCVHYHKHMYVCAHYHKCVYMCVCVHDHECVHMSVTVWVSHLCPHTEEGGWLAEGEAGGDTRPMLPMVNNFISK